MLNEKIEESKRHAKDLVFYINMLTFDINFNSNELQMLSEDVDEAVEYIDLWIKDLKKLKRSL